MSSSVALLGLTGHLTAVDWLVIAAYFGLLAGIAWWVVMQDMKKKYRVVVIGGCGHVGLPLALVSAKRGHRTTIYDLNLRALATVRQGRMPFLEHGGENFTCVPCLNAADDHIALLADLVQRELAGWI